MKKFLASILLMAMFVIALPMTSNAQIGKRRYARSRSQVARTYQRPSFYRRHRNLINVAAATGAGALIGGIAKGRRGALIGAGTGAGAGALYTYVLKKKKRRY